MIQETSAGAQTVFAEAEDCEKVKMGAPQVTIETITVTRPLKVIAFTCCVITVILMVGATSTSDWMVTDEGREGLFMQCINENAKAPLPFGMKPEPGCTKARSTSYLRGCAALCIIGVFIVFFGTVLTCLGLKSTDPNKKYKYYWVSIYALIVAGTAFLLTVIIYPVQFAKDLDDGTPRVYSFGFGYGATWGSIILIYSSVVLLICDRESEEIFYKERQMEEDEEEETGEA